MLDRRSVTRVCRGIYWSQTEDNSVGDPFVKGSGILNYSHQIST